MDFEDVKKKITEADCVLIGFGEEYREETCEREKLLSAYNALFEVTGKKNYYILNICDDKVIFDSGFDDNRIAAPFCNISEGENHDSETSPFDREQNSMWDNYMKWLSCTINNKLLILELGCLMGAMEIVRWPFEKTVMLNNKSELIRVNETFPFVPAEISEKSTSIKCNSVDFLL